MRRNERRARETVAREGGGGVTASSGRSSICRSKLFAESSAARHSAWSGKIATSVTPSAQTSCQIPAAVKQARSEEHTSELQSLMRISYAVFCLKKKKQNSTSYTLTTAVTTPHNNPY